MKRRTLDFLAMPRTTVQYAMQAVASARRRQKQFFPGQEPPTAPGEDPVSHYSGPVEDVVPGAVPEHLFSPADLDAAAKPEENALGKRSLSGKSA